MKWYILVAIALMILTTLWSASATIELDQPLDAVDEAAFDDILEPVMMIYNFIKYAATLVAGFVLVYAGISYMTSGSDPAGRQSAKGMATYVVIGLVIIWVAPLIIDVLVN